MGVALLSLCAWAYVKYSGEFMEVRTLIDLLAETLWEQVAMGVALLSLCAWAYVKYSAEFSPSQKRTWCHPDQTLIERVST
ncbi:hypothetical protein NQZ68_003157 [Dissostichus eleginoides]|nr:hypothetical protein NQZ68_003157 [Dissostichus eleginoides]